MHHGTVKASRFGKCVVLLAALLVSGRTRAQSAPPGVHEDEAFDFMNLLSKAGLRDLSNEQWNAYGQFTYITMFKAPFYAPYTNAGGSNNSFSPDFERSYAATFSLFFGVRLWRGAEVYFAPEAIAERALSGLKGLGGVTEIFELQKTGSETPVPYRARLFYRQSIGFGGKDILVDSNPLQLGTTVKSRRLVLTLGNYAMIDVFDKNNVTWDPRQTFFNEAFMTHASYDFPAEARGFTIAASAELYWDDWALRVGRGAPPQHPNEHSLDFRFWQYYGDSVELEHDHKIKGLAGAVRLLGYRNQIYSGSFGDAINAFKADPTKNAGSCPAGGYNYGSGNFNAPDLCWVRKQNVKAGIGVNAEQFVAKDVGVFVRAMIADGQTEVDAFDSADADLSFGAVAKGALWHRPFDVAGIGLQLSWISSVHAQYLAMGGVEGFIGDGRLKQAAEGLFEAFYSVNLFKAIWLAADFQMIWNPAYNADRAGPIFLPGVKAHAEF